MNSRSTFFIQLLLIIIFSLKSHSQNKDEIFYRNTIQSGHIKTVQFYSGSEHNMPVYRLGSDEKIILKFDDLSGENRDYRYTIFHCTADWNKSYFIQNEYIEGFVENPLTDFVLSDNTTMTYFNYQLSIPNEQINLKFSGNYVLIIYEGQNPEKPVLTRRFYVLDSKVKLAERVKRATFDGFKGDNQEVDFSIYHPNLRIINPMDDIKVVLMKNKRWDNSISDLKPNFVRGDELVYNYDKENVFKGGNEYRFFDIRTTRLIGENVFSVNYHDPYYHVTLHTDEIRSNTKYVAYKEMNGNYIISSQDGLTDVDTQCDYVFVHFKLNLESPLLGGNVFVLGALTDWDLNKSNAMSWNFETKAYELTLLLKQGYYNYQYAYVPPGKTSAEEDVLEGSHAETENEYQIFVYHKNISLGYDELVGFKVLQSQ